MKPSAASRFEVELIADLVYGQGRVGASGSRPLQLDLYLPRGDQHSKLPAIVLAFGGAFHRGSRKDDRFGDEQGRNRSIADWCAALAARGYPAASIDYRLVPEDPQPGVTPVIGDADAIPRSRVDVVRKLMGLGPADNAMLWRGLEAAADDLAAAFRFVQAGASGWGIDPSRIAVGGFSAGARSALNAAFGERVGAAAVVSLSGYVDAADLKRHLAASAERPPVLLVSSERDLDYIRARTAPMSRELIDAGVDCEWYEVPGATHFYPGDANAVHRVGPVPVSTAHPAEAASTVEAAVLGFLQRVLG